MPLSARIQKAPSPELWPIWGTIAGTLVNARKVLMNMVLRVHQVRQPSQGFAKVRMKARACFWYTLEAA